MAQAQGNSLQMTSQRGGGTAVRIAKDVHYNTAPRQPLYQSTKPCRYTIQQQQQQHYNEYLHHQQNLYDYKMKTRPLPPPPPPDQIRSEPFSQNGAINDFQNGDHDPNQEEFR